MKTYPSLIAAIVFILTSGCPVFGQHIFWTSEGDFVSSGAGSIWTAPLDGSSRTLLYDGLNRPLSVVADPMSGMLYWAEEGIVGDSRIARAPMSGNGPVEVLYQGSFEGNAATMALHSGTGEVFWTTTFKGIYRGSADGSAAPQFLGGSSSSGYLPMTLDVTGGHLFYYAVLDRKVFRMDADGTNDVLVREEVGSEGWEVKGMTTDGGWLYYTDSVEGSVNRFSTDGTDWVTLANFGADSKLAGIAAGPDGRIYFGGSGAIWSMQPDGSGLQKILDRGTGFHGIAVVPEPRTCALILGLVAGSLILARRTLRGGRGR